MAILRVQGNARATGTASPIVVTLTSTPTAGNVLIAVIGTRYSSQSTVTGITQTNVAWSKQIAKLGTAYVTTEIWLGIVSANAGTAVSVALSGTVRGVVDVCEYSGVATSGFLDKTASAAAASGTALSTGTTETTTQADELWIGGTTSENAGGNQTDPTNGFALLDGAVWTYLCLGYLEKIVSATGAANSGTTIAVSTRWCGCIATFKAAAGGTAHYVTCTEIFGVLDSKTRSKTVHRTLTELLGALDSKTRVKSIHRAITELFGALDAKTRTKTIHRTFTELLGGLDTKARVRSIQRAFTELLGASDSKTRLKTVHRTITELFGALDSKTRAKSIHRTFTELFGGLDAKTRVKQIHRSFTELLGGLDVRTRTKSIFRSFMEKLGLSDSFSKTKGAPVAAKQWGYSVPFSIFRKIGLSGAVIRPQQVDVKLKAGLLDRKALHRRIHGKAVVSVSQPIKVNVSSLLRRKTVGMHGISVVHVGKRSGVHGHLLRPAESSARVVGKAGFGLVAEVLGLLESTYTFMFVAVTDDKTCDLCMKFDKMIVDGAEIERMFPYATQVDYSLWMVNIHPSCRCFLVLLEIGA